MDIGINLWLMLLVFCLFILCIFLLNHWLYKPLLNFMDARDKMIKNDLESSSSNDNEITEIKNQINIILKNAKQEAISIKEQAQIKAKNEYDKEINKINTNNEKEFISFIESLNKERDYLKQELLLQIPNFKHSLKMKLKQMQSK